MSQSGTIAGAILAAFILFLAAKNRLGTYTAVLWGPTAAPPPSGNLPSSGSSSGLPTIPGASGGSGSSGGSIGGIDPSTAADIIAAIGG